MIFGRFSQLPFCLNLIDASEIQLWITITIRPKVPSNSVSKRSDFSTITTLFTFIASCWPVTETHQTPGVARVV